MAKIIYFTADETPTTEEKADIVALLAAAVAPYEIAVRNSKIPTNTGGAAGEPEAADFVAGTIPEEYEDEEAFPVFDLDVIPLTVEHGDTIAVINSADTVTQNGTAVIAAGVLEVQLAATRALLASGATFAGVTGAGANTVATITIAGGVITAIACAAP